MRLVATEYISLDGVFEEPGQWSFPFFDDEAAQWSTRSSSARARACSPMVSTRPFYD